MLSEIAIYILPKGYHVSGCGPSRKYADYLDSIDAFRGAGLELEPFGDESFNITTIPAFVPEKGEEEAISYILDEFNNNDFVTFVPSSPCAIVYP